MDPSLLPQLKEEILRCEALPPEEQEARLRELSRTHPELERELRSLLRQAPLAEPSDIGGSLGIEPPATGTEPTDGGSAFRQLGPYHLNEVLGVGGMGIVYRAEQREPLRREVAVKLLRGGLDPSRVLARFAAERRAMALLEHPAIARILDAGLDVDGMPFIVTELVRGTPISDYCRERQLPVPQVLRLFIDVCRAVQHAHQKGIIHRDLKPSNLLVTEVDGAPRPKVIDFGIARILEEEGGLSLTVEGQAIGTLGYMSPEQAAGRSRAIDTRSDVYSLGAVLYELLTGALPHALEGASVTEALLMVSRDDPRPLRLAQGARTHDSDLETIVLKALAREPEKRYEGAGAFADDLERYLGHEAILARPPSAVYELRKLIRRHRTTFVLGATGFVLIASFAVSMAVMYAGQRRERERAELEASRTAAMNRFLLGMLGAASPKALGRSVTVREALDHAMATADAEFAHAPQVKAAVITTLGTTYRELGQHEIADSLLRRGLDLERHMHGPRHIEVARGLQELATNAFQWRHTGEADSLGRLALTMSEEVSGPRSPEVESCLLLLGDIQVKLGHEAEAESLLARYLDMARTNHGETSAEVGRGMSRLGMARMISGKEFGSYFLEAVRTLTAALGPDHAETLEALDNYTDALVAEGRYQEALTTERDVLARTRRTHGDDHPRVAEVMYRLSGVLLHFGAYDEAESMQVAGLRIWRAALGEVNALMPAGYANMVGIRLVQGDTANAERWARRALAASLAVHAEEHPRSVGQMQTLADLLTRRGRYEEAGSLYRRIIAIRRRAYGVTVPVTAQAFGEYGIYLLRVGEVDSARAFLLSGLEHIDPSMPQLPAMRAALAACTAASEPRVGGTSRVARSHEASSGGHR